LSENVLVLRDVGFSYRFDRKSFSPPVLKQINLTVQRGEVVVLVGPSGAGKSSLLRLLNRLEDPGEGEILFDGIPLCERSPQELRRKIALLLQEIFLIEGSIRDNLLLPFDGEGGIRDRRRAMEAALDAVGLPGGFLRRSTGELSVGERQRVGIARILMTSPRVMLLDEPTSALDRENRRVLAQTIRRINRDRSMTFVVVTHSRSFAEELAGRIVRIRKGEILSP